MSKTHTVYIPLDEPTVEQFRTFLLKNDLTLVEQSRGSSRTFALRYTPLSFTPDSDQTREREDSRGESYEPGCHVLQPLEAQRESAGITFDEGRED